MKKVLKGHLNKQQTENKVKLPPDFGKIRPVGSIYPGSIWPEKDNPPEAVTVRRAFPEKSFDSVLQPVVDACINEIENILQVWVRTR